MGLLDSMVSDSLEKDFDNAINQLRSDFSNYENHGIVIQFKNPISSDIVDCIQDCSVKDCHKMKDIVSEYFPDLAVKLSGNMGDAKANHLSLLYFLLVRDCNKDTDVAYRSFIDGAWLHCNGMILSVSYYCDCDCGDEEFVSTLKSECTNMSKIKNVNCDFHYEDTDVEEHNVEGKHSTKVDEESDFSGNDLYSDNTKVSHFEDLLNAYSEVEAGATVLLVQTYDRLSKDICRAFCNCKLRDWFIDDWADKDIYEYPEDKVKFNSVGFFYLLLTQALYLNDEDDVKMINTTLDRIDCIHDDCFILHLNCKDANEAIDISKIFVDDGVFEEVKLKMPGCGDSNEHLGSAVSGSDLEEDFKSIIASLKSDIDSCEDHGIVILFDSVIDKKIVDCLYDCSLRNENDMYDIVKEYLPEIADKNKEAMSDAQASHLSVLYFLLVPNGNKSTNVAWRSFIDGSGVYGDGRVLSVRYHCDCESGDEDLVEVIKNECSGICKIEHVHYDYQDDDNYDDDGSTSYDSSQTNVYIDTSWQTKKLFHDKETKLSHFNDLLSRCSDIVSDYTRVLVQVNHRLSEIACSVFGVGTLGDKLIDDWVNAIRASDFYEFPSCKIRFNSVGFFHLLCNETISEYNEEDMLLVNTSLHHVLCVHDDCFILYLNSEDIEGIKEIVKLMSTYSDYEEVVVKFPNEDDMWNPQKLQKDDWDLLSDIAEEYRVKTSGSCVIVQFNNGIYEFVNKISNALEQAEVGIEFPGIALEMGVKINEYGAKIKSKDILMLFAAFGFSGNTYSQPTDVIIERMEVVKDKFVVFKVSGNTEDRYFRRILPFLKPASNGNIKVIKVVADNMFKDYTIQ